jgi:hypothetical protein
MKLESTERTKTMTYTNDKFRAKLKQATKQLENSGWEKVCSVMTEQRSSNYEFGIKFIKAGKTFFLNIATINNLPLQIGEKL